jgi:hypothetical protein
MHSVVRKELTMSNPPQEPQASVQPIDPVDSKNNSSDAQRSALDKNQVGRQSERNPAEVAGQHATGSFTDKK